MGTYRGPNIVTDGLVLALDAGSTRSYPGSGTTWYDLSGNENNGTLSAAAIGTTTSGTMTFNGTDTTISIPSPNLASSNFTVIGVAKRTSGTGRLISAGLNNWLLGHWGSFSRACYALGWITPSTGYDDTVDHIYCVTGDISGNTYTFYDNNVDYTPYPTAGTAGPNGFVLGKYFGGSEYGTGTITVLLAYNRVLTSAEITQNFEAAKGRFNIQ
jgi:hypothetical protein